MKKAIVVLMFLCVSNIVFVSCRDTNKETEEGTEETSVLENNTESIEKTKELDVETEKAVKQEDKEVSIEGEQQS